MTIPIVQIGPGGTYRQSWPITRESMLADDIGGSMVVEQINGGDSSITHRASVPFAETAKPEHRRNCHAIGLWTWTAAWVIAAIICTIIAMIGVTR